MEQRIYDLMLKYDPTLGDGALESAIDIANNGSKVDYPSGEGMLRDAITNLLDNEGFRDEIGGYGEAEILGRLGVTQYEDAIGLSERLVKEKEEAKVEAEHETQEDVAAEQPDVDSQEETVVDQSIEADVDKNDDDNVINMDTLSDQEKSLFEEYKSVVESTVDKYKENISEGTEEDVAICNHIFGEDGLLQNLYIEALGDEKGKEAYGDLIGRIDEAIDNGADKDEIMRIGKEDFLAHGFNVDQEENDASGPDIDFENAGNDQRSEREIHQEKMGEWEARKGDFTSWRRDTFAKYCDMQKMYHAYKAGETINDKVITKFEVFEAGFEFVFQSNIIETLVLNGLKAIFSDVKNDTEKAEDKVDVDFEAAKEPVKDMGFKDVDGAYDNGYAKDVDRMVVEGVRGAVVGSNPDYGYFYGADTTNAVDRRYSTQNMNVWNESKPASYTVKLDGDIKTLSVPNMRMVELDGNFYQVNPFGQVEHSKILDPNTALNVGDRISSLDISNSKIVKAELEAYSQSKGISIDQFKDTIINNCKAEFAARIERGMGIEISKLDNKIQEEKEELKFMQDKKTQLEKVESKFKDSDLSIETNAKGLEKIEAAKESLTSGIDRIQSRIDSMESYKDQLKSTLEISEGPNVEVKDRFERAANAEENAVGRAEDIEYIDNDIDTQIRDAIELTPSEKEPNDIEVGPKDDIQKNEPQDQAVDKTQNDKDSTDVEAEGDKKDTEKDIKDDIQMAETENDLIERSEDQKEPDDADKQVDKEEDRPDKPVDENNKKEIEKPEDRQNEVERQDDKTEKPEEENKDVEKEEPEIDKQVEDKNADQPADDIEAVQEEEVLNDNVEQPNADNEDISKETELIEKEPEAEKAAETEKEESASVEKEEAETKEVEAADYEGDGVDAEDGALDIDVASLDPDHAVEKADLAEDDDAAAVADDEEDSEANIKRAEEEKQEDKRLDQEEEQIEKPDSTEQFQSGVEKPDHDVELEHVDDYVKDFFSGQASMDEIADRFPDLTVDDAVQALANHFFEQGADMTDQIAKLTDAMDSIAEAYDTSMNQVSDLFETKLESAGMPSEDIEQVMDEVINQVIENIDIDTGIFGADTDATISIGDNDYLFSQEYGVFDRDGYMPDTLSDMDIANDLEYGVMQDIDMNLDSNMDDITAGNHNDVDSGQPDMEANQPDVDIINNDISINESIQDSIQENIANGVEPDVNSQVDVGGAVEGGAEAAEDVGSYLAGLL